MSCFPVTAHRALLGEAPFWDVATQALYWVDIAGKQALRLAGTQLQVWSLAEHVSAFIPCQRGDALVTLNSGVHRLNLDTGELALLCKVDPESGNRSNEARCDAHGRLWLSTMGNNLGEWGEEVPITRRSGGLWRIEASGQATPLLDGLGIPNTLLWSDDGKYVHFGDSLDGVLYRHSIQPGGQLEPRQVWFGPHARGVPDGSAMDSQGYVWNARWDGSCLLRLTPQGELDRIIELPVSRPTHCVFGGPDLKTLYITSAASPLRHPLDGAVLALDVEVPGKPCHRFAG